MTFLKIDEFQDCLDKRNEELIPLCLYVSGVAYEKQNEVSAFLSKIKGIESYKFISSKRANCVIIKTKDMQIIGFEGSSTIRHWISNLNLTGIENNMGGFYSGFYRAAHEYSNHLDILRVYVDSQHLKTVWCGHSRGGCIAGISSAISFNYGANSSNVITFGMPAYSNKSHAKWIEENMPETEIIRVVGSMDIVTKLPSVPVILIMRVILFPLYLVKKLKMVRL